MPVAEKLQRWLEDRHAEYSVLTHAHTATSAHTAEAAHIPGGQVVKAVVLKRSDGSYMLMALPADHRVHLGQLHQLLDDDICLATEQELQDLFPDCELGAVPALGDAYGLRTVVDASLCEQPVVYVECGDHESLLQFGHHQFTRLLVDADRVNAARHI